jgi:Cdc6-like AAA superfamily ATPase
MKSAEWMKIIDEAKKEAPPDDPDNITAYVVITNIIADLAASEADLRKAHDLLREAMDGIDRFNQTRIDVDIGDYLSALRKILDCADRIRALIGG